MTIPDPALRGFSACGCGCSKHQLNTYDYNSDIPGNNELSDLVEVQFKNTRKGYFRNDNHLDLQKGDVVAVEASPGHDIDVCTEVRGGDVVVMPYGYHGPSVAAPGYDLYYLNLMAGPAEDSVWLMTDDPHHTWVRQTWEGQEVDPRLPMTPMND